MAHPELEDCQFICILGAPHVKAAICCVGGAKGFRWCSDVGVKGEVCAFAIYRMPRSTFQQ